MFPAAFAVTWKKQSKWGAVSGAVGGLAAGVIAWLAQAKSQYGELTVDSTGANYPTLAGNMASVLAGLILTLVVSFIRPDDFDWEITRGYNRTPMSSSTASVTAPDLDLAASVKSPVMEKSSISTKAAKEDRDHLPTVVDEEKAAMEDAAILEDPTLLKGALRDAYIASITLTLIMMLIVPIPLFLSHYVFSVGFFKGFVVVSFIWIFFAFISCALLPIYEASGFFKDLWKALSSSKRG